MGLINTWTVGLVVVVLGYFYYKVKTIYSYFEKRGIPYVKPTFLLGSHVRGSLLLDHNTVSWGDMYNQLEGHKVGGFFQVLQPFYIVRDPEYIYRMFVSDFSHFADRGIKIDEKTNPLEGHLFLLPGQKWRYLRAKLSPIFTTGKLKWMYEEMQKCGDKFIDYTQKNLAHGKDVNLKEDLSKYTTDVIGSCAFGIDSQALTDPNSKFRLMGKKVFEPTLQGAGKFVLRLLIPDLLLKLKIKSMPQETIDFYIDIIKQAFAHRKSTGFQRKDFVQLLLELREKGKVHVDVEDADEIKNLDTLESNDSVMSFELTDELLAAQSFVFLVAGFETTASTLFFATYLLSSHPEIQQKIRDEVREVKKKFGSLNFEAVKELVYLEKVISETLRLFPPVPNLFRECTKDFTFPDGTEIEKGMFVTIPIYTIQRDPKYFPDPEAFKPERFDNPPVRGTYLPFGDGPRICIGKRFALIEMKMTLARLLESYSIEPSNKSVEPITYSPFVFTLSPNSGIYVKLKKLET